MPKHKIARKVPSIDMTAMCDVAFLLLTFFMLATKFKAPEPVEVKTPASHANIQRPDSDVMELTIDKEGRVFFALEGQPQRKVLLEKMLAKYQVELPDEAKRDFILGGPFGVPMKDITSYYKLSPEDRANYIKTAPGIPVDTVKKSEKSELIDWIQNSRLAADEVGAKQPRIIIKADGEMGFGKFSMVLKNLQDHKLNKFNLITSKEGAIKAAEGKH